MYGEEDGFYILGGADGFSISDFRGWRSYLISLGITVSLGFYSMKLMYSDLGIELLNFSSSSSVIGGIVGGQNLIHFGALPP